MRTALPEKDCVFVGRDPTGRARFACLRGTWGNFRMDVEGSDKRYNFALPAADPKCPRLAVAESPIDALSLATLVKLSGGDWQSSHYISLGGTAPRAMLQFLHDHPEVTQVSLCLDNDKAGILGMARLEQAIREDPELSQRIHSAHMAHRLHHIAGSRFAFGADHTETVLDYLLSDSQYQIDKEHIFAVGHSMGGFVCGQLAARRPEVRAGVLLMPCDIGRLPTIDREDARAGQVVREVLANAAQWLSGTSGAELAREAVVNSQTFSLENLAGVLARKPLLCVAGSLDGYTPPELHCVPLANAVKAAGGTMFCLKRYPTDHFFSDFRLSVADTVIEYLQGQASLKRS